jgi:hypothetical protein
MQLAMKTALASALALATAIPAAAQPYGAPYRPTDEYIQQQRSYDRDRSTYEAQRRDYRDQRADYRAARANYDRRMADWEGRRAAYDSRYGYGAYARAYGPAPVWDESRWASAAPSAGYYGRDTSYVAPVRCNNNSAVTAGVIGAIAGGVLGSNVAGRGDRTEGTVLGALVGGGVGAAVGHANDRYKCDAQGAYWSYNDTVPYRVSNNVYRDERSAYWSRRGCRLAPAPVNDSDYRYVRVCPDSTGRFRVTG